MADGAVLLVDDDAPIRRMLERTLGAEGYDVAAVADGGAALAQVERSLPDVIVLDVAMPGLDGLAVTRRLRAKGLVVPILLLTARDAIEERVAGLNAGADDYLVKPFDLSGAVGSAGGRWPGGILGNPNPLSCCTPGAASRSTWRIGSSPGTALSPTWTWGGANGGAPYRLLRHRAPRRLQEPARGYAL